MSDIICISSSEDEDCNRKEQNHQIKRKASPPIIDSKRFKVEPKNQKDSDTFNSSRKNYSDIRNYHLKTGSSKNTNQKDPDTFNSSRKNYSDIRNYHLKTGSSKNTNHESKFGTSEECSCPLPQYQSSKDRSYKSKQAYASESSYSSSKPQSSKDRSHKSKEEYSSESSCSSSKPQSSKDRSHKSKEEYSSESSFSSSKPQSSKDRSHKSKQEYSSEYSCSSSKHGYSKESERKSSIDEFSSSKPRISKDSSKTENRWYSKRDGVRENSSSSSKEFTQNKKVIKPQLVVKEKVPIPDPEDDIFRKFAKECLRISSDEDMPQIIKILQKKYDQLRDNDKNSDEFRLLVNANLQKILNCKNKEIFTYIADVSDEIKRRKVLKQSTEKKESKHHNEEFDCHDVQEKELSPDDRANVKKLQNAIKEIKIKIKNLEEQEVDFSDEENSVYIMEDRYKRRLVALCEKLSKITDDKMLKREILKPQIRRKDILDEMTNVESIDNAIISFVNDGIKKVNKLKHIKAVNAIADYIQVPDFPDIMKCIKKHNTQRDMDLSVKRMKEMAIQAHKAIVNFLKKQRLNATHEYISSYMELDQEDPAEHDPDLKFKLQKNKKEGDEKLRAIFKKYEEKELGLSLDDSLMKSLENNSNDESAKESSDEDGEENDNQDIFSQSEVQNVENDDGKSVKNNKVRNKQKIVSDSDEDVEEKKDETIEKVDSDEKSNKKNIDSIIEGDNKENDNNTYNVHNDEKNNEDDDQLCLAIEESDNDEVTADTENTKSKKVTNDSPKNSLHEAEIDEMEIVKDKSNAKNEEPEDTLNLDPEKDNVIDKSAQSKDENVANSKKAANNKFNENNNKEAVIKSLPRLADTDSNTNKNPANEIIVVAPEQELSETNSEKSSGAATSTNQPESKAGKGLFLKVCSFAKPPESWKDASPQKEKQRLSVPISQVLEDLSKPQYVDLTDEKNVVKAINTKVKNPMAKQNLKIINDKLLSADENEKFPALNGNPLVVGKKIVKVNPAKTSNEIDIVRSSWIPKTLEKSTFKK